MKQKILYIVLMIIALVGGKGEVWGQDKVPGYNEASIVEQTTEKMKCGNQWDKVSDNHFKKTSSSNNITFYLSSEKDLVRVSNMFDTGADYILATLSWQTSESYYFVNITQLELYAYHNLFWNSPSHSINGASVKTKYGAGDGNAAISYCNLFNNDKVVIQTGNNDSYITYISATYKIYYYTLDISSLETSISNANTASNNTITDATMKEWLNIAISNAKTFKEACAFPNSYWNGSSVGKTPAEVTTTAEKLNAITNYLIARTNANKFEQSKVPNVVYNRLHSYDQYNPNEFDTGTINTATEDIKAAINVANATTDAYQKALSTIASAENSSAMTNDPTTLAADITKAKTQLEEASDVNGINAALANIKQFDTITFNQQNEIQEGSTLTASTKSGKAITYTSSDNAILDGTTLKALKAGKVTITASTSTGNGYYGYTTTKEFTVTPKPMELEPTTGNLPVAEVEYPTITLKRTLSGICTLTLPFTTSIGEIAPGQAEAWAAQLALVTYNQADEYTLYFCKTDGTINANQPYVINLPNAVTDKQWTNITPTESPDPGNMTCNVVGYNKEIVKWTMQGNYTPNTDMNGKYGIAGGRFRLGTEGSTINAYTAYFFNSLGREKVRARVAVMDEAGNTTYIGELKDGLLQTEESIYGLDGTRLPEMRKGINIVRQKDGSVRKIVK